VGVWYEDQTFAKLFPEGWTKRTLSKSGLEDQYEALERARELWPHLDLKLAGSQRHARWVFAARVRRGGNNV